MRQLLGSIGASGPSGVEARVRWLGGAVLLAMLTAAVLTLPVAWQLGLPAAILVALALAARPRFSLLAIFVGRVVVDCLWWVEGGVGGLNLMMLYSGLIALVSGFLALQHLDRVQRHPFFLPFLLFGAVMVLGGARSGDVAVMAEMLARFVSPVLLMFLVSVMFEDDRQRRALVALIPLAAVLPLVLGFYHWHAGQMEQVLLDGYQRLYGAYSDSHNHGHAMALFAALGFFWTRRFGASLPGALSACFTAACLTLMFLTYVRTTLSGMALFLLIFLLLEGLWKVAAAVAVGAAVAVTGNAVVADRFSDVMLLLSSDPTADRDAIGSGRLRIWGDALQGWSGRPMFDLLFGMGLDQHRLYTPRRLDTHNDYLALLLQMGPLALVIYLWFQALVVREAWRLSRITRDAWVRSFAHFMIALNAMVVLANTLSNSYVNRVAIAWLFWGLCGVVFALSAEARRKQRERRAAWSSGADTPG